MWLVHWLPLSAREGYWHGRCTDSWPAGARRTRLSAIGRIPRVTWGRDLPRDAPRRWPVQFRDYGADPDLPDLPQLVGVPSGRAELLHEAELDLRRERLRNRRCPARHPDHRRYREPDRDSDCARHRHLHLRIRPRPPTPDPHRGHRLDGRDPEHHLWRLGPLLFHAACHRRYGLDLASLQLVPAV